ncbi:uncharacterized protein LOC105433580 [Pogonomyrmex barbatus]|uniref:Uncharacterized protein LOC105433580 n=1 Tax=Pogonomyrmex barbatus TaxID=144034 RepID=A0A6I9WWZ8_9HYME|nr:uncharacterized protein LOC105433580 [Pogonomyrmex barbatus]
MTLTQFVQIRIFVILGIGILGVLIAICYKIRAKQLRARRAARCRGIILQEHRDMTRCSIIEDLPGRPPSYNEVVHDTPPDYASCNNAPPLYNKTSMLEVPLSCPRIPKPQERSRDSNEPSLPSIAQHI